MNPSITHSIVLAMILVVKVFTAATGAKHVEARQVAIGEISRACYYTWTLEDLLIDVQ